MEILFYQNANNNSNLSFLLALARTGNQTTKQYNRIDISSVDCTEKLIQYFTRFPLKGERRINFLRWARVHGYKKRGLRLNKSSASKLVQLMNHLLPLEEGLPHNSISPITTEEILLSESFCEIEEDLFNPLDSLNNLNKINNLNSSSYDSED